MKTILKCVVSGAAALTLACGGGGGQSGPDISYTGAKTVVTIDESNVGSMTSMASDTASSLAGQSYGGGYLKTGTARTDLRATTARALALFASARRSSAVALIGVSGSMSQPCDGGGSETVAYSIRDPNGNILQNGDWIQIGFNQCRDSYTLETVTGTIRMLAINVDGDFPSMDDPTMLTPNFPYAVKITLGDFAITAQDGSYFGVNADMTMTILWNSATFQLSKSVHGSAIATVAHDGTQVVEASLLAAVPGTAGYSFDTVDTYADVNAYTVVANEWGMSARMCSLELAGCLDVVEDPAFFKRVADGYPDAGTLRITGASGAYVELTALDGVTGDVTLSWDLDGAGTTYPLNTVNTTWQCLNTPGLCQ
jgi:hypothetical protein